MFTVFTDSVLAGGESVHTGRGVCKTSYREHTHEQTLNVEVRLLLASFPGSEVAFGYLGPEPDLEAQAEDVRLWNEWVSVLSEDRAESRARR